MTVQSFDCTLQDMHTGDPKVLPCHVECSNGTLWIAIQGYGDCGSQDGSGMPIKIEWYDGALRVLLWGDINSEDPTVHYSMDGARESERINKEIA
jgi:hypothetical protein